MSTTEGIISTEAPDPVGAYPHARRAGPLLFLSGIGPRRPDAGGIDGLVLGEDGAVVSYDFASQCRAVFDNVESVLRSCGATRDDLLDVTVFLTDIGRDFGDFNRLYGDWIGTAAPTRTTVEVNRLPTPIAIELKCIALLDRQP